MSSNESFRTQLLRIAGEFSPPDDKGQIYSVMFSRTLRQLETEGMILGWRATEKNSPDDIKGVDFWLILPEGEMAVGVTSKPGLARQRMRKHPEVAHFWMRSRGSYDPIPDGYLRKLVKKEIKKWKKKWVLP